MAFNLNNFSLFGCVYHGISWKHIILYNWLTFVQWKALILSQEQDWIPIQSHPAGKTYVKNPKEHQGTPRNTKEHQGTPRNPKEP